MCPDAGEGESAPWKNAHLLNNKNFWECWTILPVGFHTFCAPRAPIGPRKARHRAPLRPQYPSVHWNRWKRIAVIYPGYLRIARRINSNYFIGVINSKPAVKGNFCTVSKGKWSLTPNEPARLPLMSIKLPQEIRDFLNKV